jgi:NADH:ubiquinone oxidoreductase subunit 2 (subunit N)
MVSGGVVFAQASADIVTNTILVQQKRNVNAIIADAVVANPFGDTSNPGASNTVGGGTISINQIRSFPDLVRFAMGTINQIIVLIIALGVVWTVYLAFMLIKAEGDKKDEARSSIIYGLVGIFVMISIWGLVNIFVNTFNLDNTTKPHAPTLSV